MAGSSSDSSTQQKNINSSEFIQKLTDKVYALWLRDLKIEKERRQTFGSRQNWSKRS